MTLLSMGEGIPTHLSPDPTLLSFKTRSLVQDFLKLPTSDVISSDLVHAPGAPYPQYSLFLGTTTAS
jgi:hypothetical protein